MFLRQVRRHALRRDIGIRVRYASRSQQSSSPFPVTQNCPPSTCDCTPTPAMPEGLEINHTKPLLGTMAASNEQVIICTGQSDWKSRIEEEKDGDNLANDLKELLIKGYFSDPYNSVSVINSSFPPSSLKRREIENASAYLFPSFKYVPFLPRISFDSVQALVKGYLQPEKLHPAHDSLSPIHRDRLTRSPSYRSLLPGVQDVSEYMVLICGHGSRDMRCGVLGPVLQQEFETLLPKFGVDIATGPIVIPEGSDALSLGSPKFVSFKITARVGQISHIGGHAYAGNVILCIPPKATLVDGSLHPLAGHQIWYGRIEPKHVEGVIVETLKKGRVIMDHFRGGIKQGGEILRG